MTMAKSGKAIVMGCKARDAITGFTGVVAGITVWLNGCVRYALQSQELHDGKPIEQQWFDVETLELVDEVPFAAMPQERRGGPQADPRRPHSRA